MRILFARPHAQLAPEPDYEAMDFESAEQWLAGLHRVWVAQGSPIR